MNKIINAIEKKQLKDKVTDFKIGDTIKVFTKIVEGTTERIQMFSGIVIAKNGSDKGRVLRAKLYYLRDKVGKGAKVKEQLRFTDKAAK